MKRRILVLGALLALAGALAPALVSADDSVGVQLAEFMLTPDTATVEAGAITFNVENGGTFPHEFLVIRTDLAPDALPTAGEGQVDEAQLDVVGNVRPPLDGGASGSVTLNLSAGSYVLICNVFDDAFPPGHYGRGMSAAFTVTAAAAPPAPPSAGGAGLADLGGASNGSALLAALLLAVTLGLVGAARRLCGERVSGR